MPLSAKISSDLMLNALPGSGRVIPAEQSNTSLSDTESARLAESSIRQARQQYLKQITVLRSQAQRDGYEDGLALAAQKMLQTLHATQSVYHDAEQDLVGLVQAALEKIAGDLPPKFLTPKLVLNTLRNLREPSGRISVAVHPEMTELVSEQLEAWNDEPATCLSLTVTGDETIGLLDCRLDCGDSVIEAGLAIQLRAVHRALQAIVERTDASAA